MKRTLLANLGDSDFTRYGAFLLFDKDEHGNYTLEKVDTWRVDCGAVEDEYDPAMLWDIYRIWLDKVSPDDWFMDRLDKVEESAGLDQGLLITLLESDDMVQRALGFEALAGYFGAREFDWEPLTLNAKEMEDRYEGLIESGELTDVFEDSEDFDE
jgi:hypothetical protein